jgi:acyl-CoA synthetase (NDP forming)
MSMKMREKIDKLFNPRAVAIIGASRTIGKWGFTFTLHLLRGGYKGPIYPINPATDELLGIPAYKSLEAIPEPVDLAFILLPADKVPAAVDDCGRRGIPACVIITAGFAELGDRGQALQREIVLAAKPYGMALVGPNCAGMISAEPMSLYCMMQPVFPPAGHIAVVSQSGNIAGSFLYMLWKQDIGVSRCVSVGNQAVLTTEDFLEYLIDDEQSRVVVAYLEGVHDGRRFVDVARRLTRRKPLIVIKGGKSERGVAAAKSHTGAIAGSSAVFDAICRQCGIIRVDDVEDLFDTATAFLSQPIPQGNRIGIVANGGGWGVLTADACIDAGLDVALLPEETLRRLDDRLPPWWNRQNPVDLVAGMSRGALYKAVEILCQCDRLDGMIVLGFGYGNGAAAALSFLPSGVVPGSAEYITASHESDRRGMNFLVEVMAKYRKPVLLASEFGVGAERDGNNPILDLRRKNIIVYPSSRRPAQVMARLVRYGQYLQQEGD